MRPFWNIWLCIKCIWLLRMKEALRGCWGLVLKTLRNYIIESRHRLFEINWCRWDRGNYPMLTSSWMRPSRLILVRQSSLEEFLVLLKQVTALAIHLCSSRVQYSCPQYSTYTSNPFFSLSMSSEKIQSFQFSIFPVELASMLNDLYGNVCYAGIDTDPELRYPKGAGRVAFSSQQSYIAALSARFVRLQQAGVDKRVRLKF